MTDASVFWTAEDDPALIEAARLARDNFRYFWREMAWEQRRIIPACGVAAVKAPFADTLKPGFVGTLFGGKEREVVEQMWVNQIDFDGITVYGVLLNQPNELRSVRQGDRVEVALERISDWMYSLDGKVYGAWSVHALRAQMDPAGRAQHDEAWGLNFGDPHQIEVVPADWGAASPTQEHPMSKNMAEPYAEQLAESADDILGPDPRGWSQLHYMALAGSPSPVRVLLEAGASRELTTPDGRTARDLAVGMGWTEVVALLEA